MTAAADDGARPRRRPGPRYAVTHAAAVAAVAEHGSARAAARALGIGDRAVRDALRRPPELDDPEPPPGAPPTAAELRSWSVVVLDVDPDDRVRVPAPQLVELAGTLTRAGRVLAAGDQLGAQQLLGRATSSARLLASLTSGPS